jgi:ATP-dependent Clp protease, protease subunit
MIRAHIPGRPYGPQEPGEPFRRGDPFRPWEPARPPGEPASSPVRVWQDPYAGMQATLHKALLGRRIILVSGVLDDDAAARMSAQLLTLDAEGNRPIRLQLQNLHGELTAVVTVMGILEVLHAPVHGCVSGELSGPALGVLAGCDRRTGYPNATFTLAEPRLRLAGTATAVTAREQQMLRMLDTVYFKLADVTGRSVEEIREDCRRGRVLTTGQAIGYGLVEAQETAGPSPTGA